MSNYETSASITLEVNGKNAEDRLKALRQRAEDLENALARARNTGDKIEMNKLQKELKKTNKEIREMSSSAQQAESVMRRLDRATPRELSKTLSTLRKQLDNIERGSAAWNAQIEKIKAVQRELNSVKGSMKEHESLWSRFAQKMYDWGSALTMSMAAISGLTITGRRAVQSYADMEGEMANVRKFTGMTTEEVERLNESFKTMDTRSSREQLNKLAQEAGKLGIASQQAVIEYVEAADVINVALDELGEGATRDIGKLSSIYGDAERMGLGKAMLAVGAAINEVSQNSTASASYLVDFENRMAGVGKQADMSIPKIMGYASVLDQNAQQVEMSATALQGIIMKMYQDPGKLARIAGIDVKEFARLVREDANEALLQLLDTLGKAGVAALLSYREKMKSAREAAAEAAKAEREYEKSITDVSEAAASTSKEELARLQALYRAAVDEARSKEERIEAARRLQSLYPDYFSKMSTEQIMLGDAKAKYDELTDSILKNAKAKAAADLIKRNAEQIVEIEQSMPELEKNAVDTDIAYDRAKKRRQEYIDRYNISPSAMGGGYAQDQSALLSNVMVRKSAPGTDDERKAAEAAWKAYAEANDKLTKLQAANKKLAEEYGISLTDVFAGQGDGGNMSSVSASGSAGKSGERNKFQAEDDWLSIEKSKALAGYATGLMDYNEYIEKKAELDKQYLLKKLQNAEATEKEIADIVGELDKLTEKEVTQRNKEQFDAAREEIEAERRERDAADTDSYMRGRISEKTYQRMKFESEIAYLNRLKELYAEGSQERAEIEKQITDKLQADKLAKFKETQDRQKTLYEEYFKGISLMSAEEREQQYRLQIDSLNALTKKMLDAAGNDEAKRQKIIEASAIAEKALKKQYFEETTEESFNAMEKANAELAEWLQSDGGKAVTDSFGMIMSGMSAIFSQISSIVQSNMEMETAAIEKRYDKEISLAEGNTYKVKKLEQDRENEIARAKNEANRKMFAMQVIQAVAQTAQNALAAYGSAAAIPIVGYIMAPIAAAMAVAAGAVQIAAIKKQQQASEAQGYAAGGFTRPGPVDEPAGIVHAGEWVASQKLVTSPVTRPIIDALEYAQRTNTIGSIRRVSALPAPISLPAPSPDGGGNSPDTGVLLATYFAVLKKLGDRLDEPFVTVNTVTGDRGIKKAQDEYDRLIRNKTPKSRRK